MPVHDRQDRQPAVLRDDVDEAEAVLLVRAAAEQGYVLAQVEIAVCYYEGRGVEIDDAKAFEWFRKAALQGDADSQFNVGRMFEYGVGVTQNFTPMERRSHLRVS